MPVIHGIFLGVFQHFRIEHVDLQSSTTIFRVSLEKCLELLFAFRIFHYGRVEGYGVAGAIGEAVDIPMEVSFTIGGPTSQNFSH